MDIIITQETKELIDEFNGELTKDTIVDNLNYAIESKNLLKQSLQNKGAKIDDSTPFREYANTVDELDEWKPNPEWWDIKKIVQEDTEDYPGKAIFLLSDLFDTTDIHADASSYCGMTKVKTSDGKEYTDFSKIINHTWDKTKDKECSEGYKTRYIIVYFNQESCTFPYNFFNPHYSIHNLLWIVLKDIDCTLASASGSAFSPSRVLQAVETINAKLKADSTALGNTHNLQKIDTFYVRPNWAFPLNQSYKIKNISINYDLVENKEMYGSYCFDSMFNLENLDFLEGVKFKTFFDSISSCYSIKKIPFIDLSEVTDVRGSINYCYSLEEIEALDFNSATDLSNTLVNNLNLRRINKISNINASGLKLNNSTLLEHDTLIKILNALKDYSDSLEEKVYQLTLGEFNLAKLTDDEKAIATNKGWTLA